MKPVLQGLAATAVLVLTPLAAAHAQTSPVAVGVNLGTPGIGAEVQYSASDWLVVRGDADYLKFNRDEDYSGIDYDGKLKSQTVGLFADLHPGGSPLFVSGGAYMGKRRIDIDATPSGPVDVGGATFTPAQVGRIEGEAKMSNVQPFAGLGYDNTFTSGNSWNFRGLLGVAFSSKPKVNLRATGGTLSNDPTFQTRLRQEEADARRDAKKFKYFPILQVGLTHRF